LKKIISPGPIPESWDPEALFLKAQRYAQRMTEEDSESWEYAFWSSLSLELLARAVLSNVSPALLADTKNDWNSLYHSLGFTPTESKFSPKSISITEVLERVSRLFPEFNHEVKSFCVLHTGRRNAELHSGETTFDGVPGSSWQPRFFQACQALLASMGLGLDDFVGNDEAEVARKLIAAATDDSAKAVRGEVEAHKEAWLAKGDDERSALAASARVWAIREAGHRVKCPACESVALVAGEPISVPVQRLENDQIIETQQYLPSNFQCIACSLKILGLSRLSAVHLGDRYTKTRTYDAAEYYAPQDDYAGYDDDNNEYYSSTTGR
jgi:hypothetical protein